jgi:HK97 gp10 family phage protein
MPWQITVDLSKAIPLLERLASQMESTIPKTALQTGADRLVETSKSRAPVVTGALRNSIQVGEASPTSATVEAEVEYAGFVEFGTSRMSAEPYLRPGIPEAARVVADTAVKLIQQAVNE